MSVSPRAADLHSCAAADFGRRPGRAPERGEILGLERLEGARGRDRSHAHGKPSFEVRHNGRSSRAFRATKAAILDAYRVLALHGQRRQDPTPAERVAPRQLPRGRGPASRDRRGPSARLPRRSSRAWPREGSPDIRASMRSPSITSVTPTVESISRASCVTCAAINRPVR